MESRVSPARAVSIALLIGLLGSLIFFRNLLGRDLSSTLWADNYDSRLLHWIAGWGYKVIVENGDPLAFWNAPSFYPHAYSLAFSDSLLSAHLFYIPLRMLGLPAFGALYATFACVCILGCLLSADALRRIGGFSSLELAIILFAAHFGLSISGFLAHYQIFGFELAFPFFLYLYLFLKEWRGRDFVLLFLCFAYGVCFATYLAPMLALLALIAAIPFVYRAYRRAELRMLPKKVGAASLVACALIAACTYAVQLRPYLKARSAGTPTSLDESALYSARVNSFLAPAFGGNSYWYQPRGEPTRFGDTERAFFPGFLISYTMACFLMLWTARRFRWYGAGEELAPGINMQFLRYLLLLFAASAILAFGPYPAHHPELKFPFFFLSWIVPGLEQVRAPGRFGIFLGLPAVIFSLCLLRTFFRQRAHAKALVIFFALLIVETWPRFDAFPFRPDEQGVYSRLQKVLPAGAPVLEIPVAGGDALKTLLRTTDQLHGTLIHNGKIVIGYGATSTPEALALAKLDLRIQRRTTRPAEALQFAEKLGIEFLVIRLNRYVPQVRAKWVKLARDNPRLETLHADDSVLILRRLKTV